MKVNLIAIGTKMPSWVNEGYHEYAKRLVQDFQLNLIELPAQKRGKQAATQQIIEVEGKQLLEAVPPRNKIIALERTGKALTTHELASELTGYHDQSQDISILIGGPEGIPHSCLATADKIWSLSKLTLPHPLVRIVIAEQIYRAWSIMAHHPYHR